MYLDFDQAIFSPGLPSPPQPTIDTLYEQGSSAHNEDVLFTATNLHGVFDGATSLDGHRFAGGLTGGRLAAEIAAESFRYGSGSLVERAAMANEQIRRALFTAGIGPTERHRFWSTSLAVVSITHDRLHFCQTGDAHILLIDSEGGCRLVSREIDIDGETLALWQEASPTDGTPIHELLADQIRQVRLQMNRRYGVLNGEPEALQFLHHGTVPLDGIRDVLLFTDGLLLPQEQPGRPQDWRIMAELYLDGGLPAIHQRVRQLQESDPGCRRYPRFKHHDDIAAVAVSLLSDH